MLHVTIQCCCTVVDEVMDEQSQSMTRSMTREDIQCMDEGLTVKPLGTWRRPAVGRRRLAGPAAILHSAGGRLSVGSDWRRLGRPGALRLVPASIHLHRGTGPARHRPPSPPSITRSPRDLAPVFNKTRPSSDHSHIATSRPLYPAASSSGRRAGLCPLCFAVRHRPRHTADEAPLSPGGRALSRGREGFR